MRGLKFTLSKEDDSASKKKNNDSLLRGVNKSKSQSIWALDIEETEEFTKQSIQSDGLLRLLSESLKQAFQKDSHAIAESIFENVVKMFCEQAGQCKSQLVSLTLMQNKLADVCKLADEDFTYYVNMFAERLRIKIAKLRKREKKSELSNYDSIVRDKLMKKHQFTIEQAKPQFNTEKSSLSSDKKDNDSSNENYLKIDTPLLNLKSSGRSNDEVYRPSKKQNDSISLSTVLATSITVKSRRRKSTEVQNQKSAANEQGETDQGQKQGDQAFIFYRPKKGRK